MRAIQIHDADHHALAFDLREALAAIGPRVHQTHWTVGGVPSHAQTPDATGEGAKALEDLARSGERVTGTDLMKIAREVRQTIWGEFKGYADKAGGAPWIVIVAFDSSWFEVRSDDGAILARIKRAFKDVRTPPTS